MASSREECLFMAKLAEQAGRYDDMIKFMEKMTAAATAAGDDLTDVDCYFLSVAYKKAVDNRRASWRVVFSTLHKEESRGNDHVAHVAAIRDYLSDIESELSSICNSIIHLLDAQLIRSACTLERKVFYLKLKGDYYRYLADLKMAIDREEAAESALAAYTSAQDIALTELVPAHPLRLGLALNFAVFYGEIRHSPELACNLAKEALENSYPMLGTLEEATYRESAFIIQILRHNLTSWSSAMQAGNGDEATSKSPGDI